MHVCPRYLICCGTRLAIQLAFAAALTYFLYYC